VVSGEECELRQLLVLVSPSQRCPADHDEFHIANMFDERSTLADARARNAASGFFFHPANVAFSTSLWLVATPMDSISCVTSFMSSISITSPPKLLLMMAAE
jgi:hypothetical protein